MFQKPAWCAKMGDQITPDCRQAADGRTFFIFAPFFLDGTQVSVLLFSLMYFLLGFQALKIHFSEGVVKNEMIKFNILLLFFCSSLLVNIFEGVGGPGAIGGVHRVQPPLRVLLLQDGDQGPEVFHQNDQLFVGGVAAVVRQRVRVRADRPPGLRERRHRLPSFFQGYSFSSFADSVNSIFGLMFLSGFPDIMVDAHAKNPLSVLIFVPFLIFSCILISYSITGNYYFHFKMCYIENLNQQYGRFPDFRTKVVPLLKEKFLNPEQAKSAMKQLARRRGGGGDQAGQRRRGQEGYPRKVAADGPQNQDDAHVRKQDPQNSFRNTYIKARTSFAYKVVDFVLSTYDRPAADFAGQRQKFGMSENVPASCWAPFSWWI